MSLLRFPFLRNCDDVFVFCRCTFTWKELSYSEGPAQKAQRLQNEGAEEVTVLTFLPPLLHSVGEGRRPYLCL